MNARAWSIARFPQEGMLAFTAILWLGYFVVVLGVTVAISIFGTVDRSIWEHALALPRWFAFGTGIWLTGTYLRLYVAHGGTRREFLQKSTVYLAAFAVLLAGLIALGFLLEWVLYQATGWPHPFPDDLWYTLVARILPTFAVVFGVWSATGAAIAAGYRRLGGLGLAATIPAGITVVLLTEKALDTQYNLPFVFDAELSLSFAAAVGLGLAAFLVALAGTWALSRDVPVPSAGA